ncbi:hypothetical protein FRC07_003543, partial [Ceratobasidium sp. 392]
RSLPPQSTNPQGDDDSEETPYNDLEALSWLAENARDPVVSDCACQAGSRESVTSNSQPSLLSHLWRIISRQKMLTYQPASSLKHNTIINGLFDHACTRLDEANLRQQRDLKACQGINVARYSGALPTLVFYLEQNLTVNDRKGKRMGDGASNSPAQRALGAIDSVWRDDCPEFSSDAYALLAAAELRLTEVVTHIYHSGSVSPVHSQTRPLSQVSNASESPAIFNLANHTIDEAIIFGEQLSLLELRARYSRALVRTGILLKLHNDSRTLITPYRLTYLLDSIRFAAQCVNLNPISRMSTALPQPANTKILPEFRVALGNTGSDRYIPPNDIGDEDNLLSSLVKVLSSSGIETTPQVEIAASRALEAIGPLLVRQWLNVTNEFSIDISNKETLERVITIWPKIFNLDYLPDLPGWSLSQLLCVATVALSQANCPYMADLIEIAVTALHCRATMESGEGMICYMANMNRELFETFVQMVDWNVQNLSHTTLSQCLQIFVIESFETTILRDGGMAPASLKSLLHLLARTPGHLSEVQFMFKDLRHLLPLYFTGDGQNGVSYLSAFMNQSESFMALADVALIPEYHPLVVDFVSDTLALATQRSSENPEDKNSQLTRDAIPGLLAVVRLAMQIRSSDTDNITRLSPFLRSTISVLTRTDTETLLFAISHPALALVDTEMEAIFKMHAESELVKAEWEEMQAWAPVDGWHLGGLRRLFDLA